MILSLSCIIIVQVIYGSYLYLFIDFAMKKFSFGLTKGEKLKS